MNWDDMRFFLAVARSRTLTEAARQLGVNHSTVSRRLASLQEEMGARLLERRSDGWTTTAAGDDVREVAERMEEDLLTLDRQVLGIDKRLSGPLRVTTLDLLAVSFGDCVERFIEAYPGIELELSTSMVPVNLTRREADVALRLTNAPPEHLVGRRLGHAAYGLYGARSLVERAGTDDPAALPWVCWDERMNAKITNAWMQSNVPDATVACRVDSVQVMIDMLTRGVGIQFVPCFVGEARPALVRLREVPEPDFGVDLWVLTHPDLRHTARVRAFLTHAGDYFGEQRDLLEGRAGAD